MTWCPLHLLQSILRGFLNKVPNSAGKKFFSSFKLLSASCTYSEQLCHRAKRIDVSEKEVSMFEDENLDDLDIGFPSPTAPSSPGTRASSLEVPEARGKGQEEDFGECCSSSQYSLPSPDRVANLWKYDSPSPNNTAVNSPPFSQSPSSQR